jgi:hypothetical protein
MGLPYLAPAHLPDMEMPSNEISLVYSSRGQK